MVLSAFDLGVEAFSRKMVLRRSRNQSPSGLKGRDHLIRMVADIPLWRWSLTNRSVTRPAGCDIR